MYARKDEPGILAGVHSGKNSREATEAVKPIYNITCDCWEFDNGLVMDHTEVCADSTLMNAVYRNTKTPIFLHTLRISRPVSSSKPKDQKVICDFAWLPVKLTSGQWIWLREYFISVERSLWYKLWDVKSKFLMPKAVCVKND